MSHHLFLLQPSSWLGEGKIRLNMVEEELAFFTRWSMGFTNEEGEEEKDVVRCLQEIQVKGMADIMHNQFTIRDCTATSFVIELENQALGKITGIGLLNQEIIGWEFRIPELGFEGFEFYEKQPDDSYLMRAEYATSDQFRTMINGKIWQPITKPTKKDDHE
jgi:hypothetical protein